jgi:DNA transformation protein and related proteins
MTVSDDFLAYVLEQLGALGELSSRRMFGGAGLYCDELFFGLIADDTLYLRVDDANRGDYTARSMQPFRPYADRPQLSMSYYEAPAEVLDNASELSVWARRAVEVAMRAPVKPGVQRTPGQARRGTRATPRGGGLSAGPAARPEPAPVRRKRRP